MCLHEHCFSEIHITLNKLLVFNRVSTLEEEILGDFIEDDRLVSVLEDVCCTLDERVFVEGLEHFVFIIKTDNVEKHF